MRAFSRIPSTGGGSAGQGYVAGQSNRLTSATYFDANGVMRVAPPKALRPNYVYKNGVWVRDGWLREGQATNYYSPTSPVTTVEGMMGVLSASQTATTFSPDMPTPSETPAVVSCILKRKPGTTDPCGFWWGANGGRPILNINPDDATISGNTTYYNASCTPLGNGWAYFVGYFNSPTYDGWFPPWFPSSDFYMTIMLEYGTKPTSWVPYGTTRAAD